MSSGEKSQAANTDHIPECDIVGDVDEGLLATFWRYEYALMDNNIAALDELFVDDITTLRGDADGVLVGHRQIAGFRAARPGGAPARRVSRLHIRVLGPQCALIMAETIRDNGARGLQTQLWQSISGEWRISAAHVATTNPRDPHVWRLAGDPLCRATRSGPLDGKRVAVKDLFAIIGHRIGGGTPTYLAITNECTSTAPAVQRLMDAGADIAGIAHTDELAYSLAGVNPHYGCPDNPAAPGRIPGGSSSGPAVAVSGGEVQIGLGTDTAGSVRVPASYQGIWGMRSTHGSVPTDGMLHLAPSFDAVGWLTADLETLRSVVEVCVGASECRPDTHHRNSDIDILIDPGLISYAERAVVQQVWETVHVLSEYAEISYTTLISRHLEEWFAAFRIVQAYEAWRTHTDFLVAHPQGVSGAVADRFRVAAQVSEAEVGSARGVVADARRRLDDLLPSGRNLLLPATPGPAPRNDELEIDAVRYSTLRLTCLASLSGRPAISAPCWQSGGMPVGLSLIGWRGGDLDLVATAGRVADITGRSAQRSASGKKIS
ncbi:MAG: DUF3225 domain-containing protein [Gordonia sp. (in: high G+C Gram-positive bacteria)]